MSATHAHLLLGCCVCIGLLRAETPPQHPAPPLPAMPPAGAATAQTVPVPAVPYVTKTPSSTSTTKQFMVYGADMEMRSAFCMLCEETASALGRVLKDDARFVLPVIVVLKTPPDIRADGPPVTPNIVELTSGGFHLQVNAELRTGFRKADFTREMVRVLLAERILRNHQKLSTRKSDVLPAWVMVGVTQALEYRSRSRPSALFSAVFKRGQVYSLDRILTADPNQLDALSRGIYETSTCALVLTLLDQPDGPVRFSRFLNALAVESKSDRELLTQYFPNLAASKSAFEKWWSLQMAALATPSVMETLGVAQTEEELDKALTLLIPGSRKREEPAAKSAERPTGKETGAQAQADLESAPEPSESHAGELDAMPAFRAPTVPSLFGGSKKIIFGFKKKPKGEDETEAADKPKEEKAKDANAKDPKKPAPAPVPARSETAKPDKVEASPATKPKADPPADAKVDGPAADAGNKESDDPKADEAQPGKPSLLNPLNWFRRKSEPGTNDAEAETPTAKPAEKAAPKAASKPASPKTAEGSAPSSLPAKVGTIPLEDYALIAKHADRTQILSRSLHQLNALRLRAHPLYKALIADYLALVENLIEGKTKGASSKLDDLRQQRDAIHDRALAVETHLDWYEANHSGVMSHAFEDFLQLDHQLEKERLPRNDDLSKYLDAVQGEFK